MKNITFIFMLFGATTFAFVGCGNDTKSETEQSDAHNHEETKHEEGDGHNHSANDTTHNEADHHSH